MKRIFPLFALLLSTHLYAVDGYNDIYLDREQPIKVHGIYCGENPQQINKFKPSIIYTNSEHIEKGTYYFTSQYGEFSYTFNVIPSKDTTQLMGRGMLTAGKTQKSDMKKELCIVGKIAGLPNNMLKNISTQTISVNDPEWNLTMKKYAVFGKPAFGKGVFKDQRTAAKHDAHDQKVFLANQKYIKKTEQLFVSESKKISRQLPKKVKDAIKYAHKNDGFLMSKTYPVINEPLVWTPTAKERYSDQVRQLDQKKQWDIIIQKNFDWLFSIVGKDNKFKTAKVKHVGKPIWKQQTLEQTVTLLTQFKNGKTLELDFVIKSAKIESSIFDSLETIQKQSHLIRNNPIASSKKPRAPIKLPIKKDITVYTPTEKIVIFFSPFRDKKIGDTYRYQ